MRKTNYLILGTLCLAAYSAQSAQPMTPVPIDPTTCLVSDVTITEPTDAAGNALGCEAYTGNDKVGGSELTVNEVSAFDMDNWKYLGKLETDDNDVFDPETGAGLTPHIGGDVIENYFSITTDPTMENPTADPFKALSGDWKLKTAGLQTASDPKYYTNFMLAVKTSQEFALYNFSLVKIFQDNGNMLPSEIHGTWSTAGLPPNRNGKDQALSHFTLYAKIPDFITIQGDPVPEPATLALFGLGMGAMGLLRRRREGA